MIFSRSPHGKSFLANSRSPSHPDHPAEFVGERHIYDGRCHQDARVDRDLSLTISARLPLLEHRTDLLQRVAHRQSQVAVGRGQVRVSELLLRDVG